jgi:hypothetical protein
MTVSARTAFAKKSVVAAISNRRGCLAQTTAILASIAAASSAISTQWIGAVAAVGRGRRPQMNDRVIALQLVTKDAPTDARRPSGPGQ